MNFSVLKSESPERVLFHYLRYVKRAIANIDVCLTNI